MKLDRLSLQEVSSLPPTSPPAARTLDILACNIKRIRLEQGLSQEEVAHRADVDLI
jgi:hypothetical protein